MEPFSVASRFPNRRRVIQACVNCSRRKTRCDGGQPQCGLCARQRVECFYRDSQQPRIDYNTQVVLERIQLLEDRLTSSSSGFSDGPSTQRQEQQYSKHNAMPMVDLDVQVPRSHTANANHVFSWPVIRDLLLETSDGMDLLKGDAADVFFGPDLAQTTTDLPVSTWKLYPETTSSASEHRDLINTYFAQVNAFFPLLSLTDIIGIHEAAVAEGAHLGGIGGSTVSPARYALLLLVLSLASLMKSGGNLIYLDHDLQRPPETEHNSLWCKAKLLLGTVSSEISLTAGQCTLLASLYCGAIGKIADSFHWAHASAVKCEILARYYTRESAPAPVPDEFCRLFWVTFIVEGDFFSEISITLPPGLPRYEDLIPYPDFHSTTLASDPNLAQQEEVAAFQITTNASIRRFLNRVNGAVYNAKEQQRQQSDKGADHALWLLRIAEDLWSHHAAVYRNLPKFLLTSSVMDQASPMADSPTAHIAGLIPRGNNPWNILRLQGRYFAGQYIIHRPFVEYALLNASTFASHPCNEQIIARCKRCFEGCVGFLGVFDVEPANSITCLFATGMVTFTMTMILMVATISPLFRDIQPENVEESIHTGIRNLRRFSRSVGEFSWHLRVLNCLETSRKIRLANEQ